MAVTGLAARALRATTRQSTDGLMAELRTRTYPPRAPMPQGMRERYEVVEDEVEGCTVLRLTPKTGATAQHLLYTHGGSYVNPIVAAQWWFIDRMTRGSGVRITLPFYRLAPESTVGPAYDLLRRVYLDLVESGPVTLAGDSAGGGLALGQAVAYRDAGLPRPRQVVLVAPWVDLTLSNSVIPSLGPFDPVLRADSLRACGVLWAGDRDLRDPMVSPLFSDLDGLPPVHTFQGGYDILAADAQVLASRLQQSGNPGTFTFAPAAIHDYLAAFWTPEARSALRAVNRLLRE